MKRLLFTASWMLAFVVFGTAAGPVAAHPPTPRAGSCHRLYWQREGVRYAEAIYVGTAPAARSQRIQMSKEIRCQHNLHAHRYVRRTAKRLRHTDRVLRAKARRAAANTATWNHSTVSWYDDSGSTASGTHYTYGVADCGTDGVCYPFGTRIEFCYHGCVTATVDDHGPYIAGRDFDLNQNTAQAIGALGVETVAWRLN